MVRFKRSDPAHTYSCREARHTRTLANRELHASFSSSKREREDPLDLVRQKTRCLGFRSFQSAKRHTGEQKRCHRACAAVELSRDRQSRVAGPKFCLLSWLSATPR